MIVKLYHGSLNHNEFEDNVFFSTCLNFAKDYGEVKQYNVTMKNTFDTLNQAHVEQLIEFEGSLNEPYDDITIHSYKDYVNTDLFGCDNWEMFEQYMKNIKQLGYDSMRIFEGGIENFVVFERIFELSSGK